MNRTHDEKKPAENASAGHHFRSGSKKSGFHSLQKLLHTIRPLPGEERLRLLA